VVVVVLNVTPLAMGFVFLYRAWREIFAFQVHYASRDVGQRCS
jgi:hypothetical protein